MPVPENNEVVVAMDAVVPVLEESVVDSVAVLRELATVTVACWMVVSPIGIILVVGVLVVATLCWEVEMILVARWAGVSPFVAC